MSNSELVEKFAEEFDNFQKGKFDVLNITTHLENFFLNQVQCIYDIDNMIIGKYNGNIVKRLEYYDSVFNHSIPLQVVEICKDDEQKDIYVHNIIYLELFKISLCNALMKYLQNKLDNIRDDDKNALMHMSLYKICIDQKKTYKTFIDMMYEKAENKEDIDCLLNSNKEI